MNTQRTTTAQFIKHELDGRIYTPYYTDFEWAMDLTSREVWEGLKEQAYDITCVTTEDPDYRNPIRFPRYTPECEADHYTVKTFKIRERDYVTHFRALFEEYRLVKSMPKIILNFQKTAFLKNEDTILHLNPLKELKVLFILFDHYIAVQDGENRRFLMGHPMEKLPPALLARHAHEYSPGLSHLLKLILETDKAPDSNCFVLIDKYQDHALTRITINDSLREMFTQELTVGFQVSNGDTIHVEEYERIQDYGVAAFRCYLVQIMINGELLEDLNRQLTASTVPASCVTADGMVRCITYSAQEEEDYSQSYVLVPVETVRYLPIHKIVDDFVFLDKSIGYDPDGGIQLLYR